MRLRGCLNRGRHSERLLARLFIGRGGVRAGWRAALFLLVLAVQLVLVAIALHAAFHALAARRPLGLTPALVGLNELVLLLPTCGASVLMAFLEDVRPTGYGLVAPRKWARCGAGFAAGLAALGALMLCLSAGGFATGQGGGLSPGAEIRYALEWLGVSLLIGVTEEFALRGYLLVALTRGAGFWGAAGLTSLVFGALHGMNHGETPLGLIDTVGAGLLFCVFIRCTGSLWFAIGFHGAWDYAENFLFGTADSGNRCVGTLLTFAPRGNVYFSGGVTGPEGSVFCTAILLLAALLASRFLRPAAFLAVSRAS
jgi:membrane protease YdiL (CAAX protease family)